MITYKNGSDTAVIVLHEIYGINEHILKACDRYRDMGYDVYCPNLIDKKTPFDYCQQETAYDHFKMSVGFDVYLKVLDLLEDLRPLYRVVFLIGFSIGATIAWRCSGFGLCDGIIGYYGSRIRDFPEVNPKCRVLLIFAENEHSFDPINLCFTPEQRRYVSMTILKGNHGFCDTFSDNFDSDSAKEAQKLTDDFIQDIISHRI